MATITSLGFNIWSRFSGDGVREARRELEKLDGDLRNINQSFLVTTGRVRVLVSTLIAVAPAAALLGTVTVAAAGAASASLFAAAAAGGIYGGVLSDTIHRTMQLRKKGQELSESQMEFIVTLDRLKDTWAEFLKVHESNTLSVARDGIDGLTAGVSRLNPIMEATHPIIKRTSEAWKAWMEGDGSQRFADNILQYGVPALDDLMSAGRNTLAALGAGFREALQHSEWFSGGLLRLSEQFQRWAVDSNGFERFFNLIEQFGPQVRDFFNVFGQALGQVLKALADIAPLVLDVVILFLQMIANTPIQVLQALYIAFVSLNIIQGITNLVNMFTAAILFLTSPIGMVAAAIGLLVGAFVYLKTQTDFFETTWPVIWENVRKYAEPTITWLIDTVKMIGDTFATSFRIIAALIRGDFNTVLLEMQGYVDRSGNYWIETWNRLFASVKNDVVTPTLSEIKEEFQIWSADWNSMWDSISQAAREEWDKVKTDAQSILPQVGQTLRDEEAEWEADWSSMWSSFGRIAKEEWERTKIDAQSILPQVGQTLREEEAEWEADWSSMWTSFGNTAKEEWERTKTDATTLLPQIGQTLREEGAIWKADWDSLWSGFKTTVSEEWTSLKTDFTTMWSGLGQSLREEEAEWEADWSSMWTSFGNLMTEEGELMKVDVETILSSLGSTFTEEWENWKTDWGSLWGGFTSSLSEEWGIIQSQLTGSLGSAGESLRTEGSIWATDWTTLWDGFTSSLTEEWNTIWTDLTSILPTTGTMFREEWEIWKTDWSTLWNGVKTTLSEEWTNMQTDLGGILPAIGSSLREEGAIWKADWDSLWPSITQTLREEWEEIKRETAGGVDAIGRFWEGLKEKIKGPVQWIIDVVWNNGLRAAWNWISKLWGGQPIQPFTVNFGSGGGVAGRSGGGMQTFASGGPVRGPGSGTSDSIPARLSNGEHVWTAREVQAAGGHAGVAQLRSAALGGKPVRVIGAGGFAEGGGFWDGVRDFFTAPHIKIATNVAPSLAGFEAAMNQLRGAANGAGGASLNGEYTPLLEMAQKLPWVAAEKMLEFVRNKLAPQYGEGMGWKQMWDIVRRDFPDATLTSSLRPGASDFHGSGQAIDVAWAMTSFGMRRMMDLNRWLAQRYPNSTELIYTPGVNLKHGKPFGYSQRIKDQHYNHVHWAMAGMGGGGGGGLKKPVQEWRSLVLQELAHFGQSPGLADIVLRRMQQESDGHAGIVNTWDINAKNGTPSKGLMQVIDPTFNAFKNTGMHPDNIFDPGANVHASMAYALSRYGSLAAAYNRPGGYRLGTFGATRGIHMVAEDGPEMITRGPTPAFFRGGEKVWTAADITPPERDSGDHYEFNIDARGATREAISTAQDELVPQLIQILKQDRKR